MVSWGVDLSTYLTSGIIKIAKKSSLILAPKQHLVRIFVTYELMLQLFEDICSLEKNTINN